MSGVPFRVLRIGAIQSKYDKKSVQIGRNTRRDLAQVPGYFCRPLRAILRCRVSTVESHWFER
jgi:hypothetical protein